MNIETILEHHAHHKSFTREILEKDLSRRFNSMRVGIEVEMYSKLGIDATSEHIKNVLGFENYSVTGDGSLSSSLTRTIDVWLEKLEKDPVKFLESEGYSESTLVESFVNKMGKGRDSILGQHIIAWEKFSEIRELIEPLRELNIPTEYIQHALDVSLEKFILDQSRIFNFIDMTLLHIDSENEEHAHIKERLESYNDLKFKASRIKKDRALVAFYKYIRGDIDMAKNIARDSVAFISWLKFKYRDGEGIQNKNTKRVNRLKGVEVKFRRPIRLGALDQAIDEIETICNDPTLQPEFIEGNTGLHIHFDLSSQIDYNFLDLFRLVTNCEKYEGKIVEYGGRSAYGSYRDSSVRIVRRMKRSIDKLRLSDEKVIPASLSWLNNRSTGVNITNIGAYGHGHSIFKHKNTVEIRFATGSICKSGEELRRYVELLKYIINISYTGSAEMDFYNVTLKEISPKDGNSRLAVIDNHSDKYIGILECGDIHGRMSKFKDFNTSHLINELNRTRDDAREQKRVINRYIRKRRGKKHARRQTRTQSSN